MSEASWQPVCELDEIWPDVGVCAKHGDDQVAIFRWGNGEQLFAIGNFDPFSKANVLSRGIVGDKQGEPKVASPIYKQNFSLRTGECLDDPNVRVPTYEVRVERGTVMLRGRED